MYRIGLPGWKMAARMGVPLSMRIHIHYDPEAGVYWANSPDLGGLVVEGASLDEVFAEVRLVAPDLLELTLGQRAHIGKTSFMPMDGLRMA